MVRKTLVPILLLAFLLAACWGQTETGNGTLPAPSTDTAIPPTLPAVSERVACTVVSALPPPSPEEQSLFPPVGEDEWVQGPETATVTIIEYSDFQ